MIVINPRAGRRPVTRDRVMAATRRIGVEADVEAPATVADMHRVILAASVEARLAVVGGDGTVNCAVNTLLSRQLDRLPILGVLPAGSGCDLLRTFGIPQRLEEAARHLIGDATYEIDVGELEGSWGVRRFANIGQAGVGAAAAETSRRLPRWLGSQRYMMAFGVRLPRFPASTISLVTPRRTIEGRALAVIFANGQFFAGGWNVAPKAMLVDGEFDLQIVDIAKTSAPALVPRIVRGLHLTDPAVTRISSPRFRLETEMAWPVEVDGDAIGNTPVDGRVLPAALRLKI